MEISQSQKISSKLSIVSDKLQCVSFILQDFERFLEPDKK